MGEKKDKKPKKKEEAAPAEAAAPAEEAPAAVAPPAEKKKPIGNVFALFNKGQIQEFKEAFTMIDTNRDGFIDESDLAEMFQQTGKEADPKMLKEMIAEAPGTLNFTNFLTLFGEKLHGTDSERCLLDSFKMFDDDNKGTLEEEYFKDLLVNVGDQFTPAEVKEVWKQMPKENGIIDYKVFTQTIKGGNQEEGG